MTSQKLYAILRKAGHGAAKWSTSGMVRGWGEWSPGVKIERNSDTYKIWFDVTYKTAISDHNGARAKNVMREYIVPALNAAGVTGEWTNEYTYRVAA